MAVQVMVIITKLHPFFFTTSIILTIWSILKWEVCIYYLFIIIIIIIIITWWLVIVTTIPVITVSDLNQLINNLTCIKFGHIFHLITVILTVNVKLTSGIRTATSRNAAEQAKQSRVEDQKKKISHLKGIESKLANIIMDEVLERCVDILRYYFIFNPLGFILHTKLFVYFFNVLSNAFPFTDTHHCVICYFFLVMSKMHKVTPTLLTNLLNC